MKVDSGKSDDNVRSKRNVMNGEASHDESPKDSNKRSRSRSKSPRNTIPNGDLMFDAALYAPERPKRNRKKPEEEIFTPVKEPIPRQPKKRKANEKEKVVKKKVETRPATKSTAKKKVEKDKDSEEEEDEPPKSKRKCAKKKTKVSDVSDIEDADEDAKDTPKSSKGSKSANKAKPKCTKKSVASKEKETPAKNSASKEKEMPAKNSASKEKETPVKNSKTSTPTKAAKKIEDAKSLQSESTDDEAPAIVKPSPCKSSTKAKKKICPKDSNAKSASEVEFATAAKPKERASKPKKSPSKIEIDGIEITELSDLNSSREDDFNSSRDSVNQVSCNDNETSVETVLYEESEENGAKVDKLNNSEQTVVTPGKEDSSVSNSEEWKSKDIQASTNDTVFGKHISPSALPSQPHLPTSVPAALSSFPPMSHMSSLNAMAAAAKADGASPSKAEPAPPAYPSPHHTSQNLMSPPLPQALTPQQQQQQLVDGEKKLLPCLHPGCKYVGKSGVLLRKHLRNHGVFECAHCEFSGNQFELLENHMKEFHPTRWGRKKCKKCCRHIRLDLHDEHEAACDGTKIWKCDECNHEFPYESTLKEHRKKHKKEKQLQCELCDFKCEIKPELKTHLDSEHPDCEELSCTKCKQTFYSEQHLASHMQIHEMEKSFPCRLCSKTFKSELSVTKHQLTHQSETMLPCDVQGCDLSYKTQRMLNAHKKQVHGVVATMFKCELEGCGMEFPKKGLLKKHQATHTRTSPSGAIQGDRRFNCDWEGCNKTFRHNANLKIHFMQHTGEKPIKCEHCDFACRQRSSILFHMKTKHPGLPIPRTDRTRSPRRDGNTTPGHHGSAAASGAKMDSSALEHDDTQDYDFGSPPLPAPAPSMAPASLVIIKPEIISPALREKDVPVDAKVYDFPDDDDEETVSLPVKKTVAKSPIRSLTEMESRLGTEMAAINEFVTRDEKEEVTEVYENVEEITEVYETKEESFGDLREEEEVKEELKEELKEEVKEELKEDMNEEMQEEMQEETKEEKFEQEEVKEEEEQEEVIAPAEVQVEQHASIHSETASQNSSSKYSEFAQEHVSENYTMNSSEGTTPGDQVASVGEQHGHDEEENMPNPIQGALDTTDDLDYQINGNESDVLDEKMLRSPMSSISEDMRALDMPNVTNDATTANLINEADLAMSPSNKKEHTSHEKVSGMPPEINAEVDALLESGLLDGDHKAKQEDMQDVSSMMPHSPRDHYDGGIPQSHLSSHSDGTPNGHYSSSYNTAGYPCDQQPLSNVSQQQHGTPERAPPSYDTDPRYSLPEYPPLSSPAGLPPSSNPSTPYSQPPTYPGVSQSPPSLPYGAPPSVSSGSYPVVSSVPPYRSPTSSASISSFAGLTAPVVTTSSSFLDAALSGRSSLDPPASSMFPGLTTTTTVTSASSSPFASSYPSSRDFFGHYFPGAADPMSGLSHLPGAPSHLPGAPSQDPTRPLSGAAAASAYPGGPAGTAASQQSSFQALQRSSADLLQRASAGALPTMNYPSVTESLARLNPQTPPQPWMTAEHDRSRSWAQASPILSMPELDSANPLTRNPFTSSRPEYNFDSAAQLAAKRPEATFPGVPQSVANPTEHRYDVGTYMGAASHFNPAAAAAAAANYGRSMQGQKSLEDAYRHSMPDYRSALSQADVYGRAMAPPLTGLDKYYNPYSRDAMYRSQTAHMVSSANPFMPPPPPSSSTQMSGYAAYPGQDPAAAAAYSKYLPTAANIPQSPLTGERSDYFHHQPPRPPSDPYDPYRRSVIHNMMTRYF